MNKDELLELFKDKLPASLGTPFIVATRSKPYTFCAFYDATNHELKDGRLIHGNEFRLWQPRAGFSKTEVLAGIFGFEEKSSELVCCALTSHGTRAKELNPFGPMIREMVCHIATDNIGDWNK